MLDRPRTRANFSCIWSGIGVGRRTHRTLVFYCPCSWANISGIDIGIGIRGWTHRTLVLDRESTRADWGSGDGSDEKGGRYDGCEDFHFGRSKLELARERMFGSVDECVWGV